jgi:hypothetical protein
VLITGPGRGYATVVRQTNELNISSCKWGVCSYIIQNFGVYYIRLCGSCYRFDFLELLSLLLFYTLEWRLKFYFHNFIAIFTRILYYLLTTRDKIHNILGAFIEIAEYNNVSQSMPAERLPVASRDRKKSISQKLCYYFNTKRQTTLRHCIFRSIIANV